jgi:hypothetical protein
MAAELAFRHIGADVSDALSEAPEVTKTQPFVLKGTHDKYNVTILITTNEG